MSNTAHILLIDDDKDTHNVVQVILESAGYQLTTLESAEDALKFLKGRPTLDAILLDIYLPNMDGYQAIKAIRDIDTKIPIIATTAFYTGTTRKEIEGWGFDGYLPKPIQPGTFMLQLEAVLVK
jgi:CheY-like chemotaxis protein